MYLQQIFTIFFIFTKFSVKTYSVQRCFSPFSVDKGIWHIRCNYDFSKDSWLGRCVSSVTQGSWCIYSSQWQHYDWGWECTQHLYWLLPFPHSVFFLCLTAISSPTGPQTFPLKVSRLITPLIRLYFTQICTPPPPLSPFYFFPSARQPSITYFVTVPVSCSFVLIIGIRYDILSQYRDILCEITLDQSHTGR